MLNNRVIKDLNLSPGTVATLALYDHLYTKDPAKIKDLLESHDHPFTGDRALDYKQIFELSKPEKQGGRGRFFTEDFESMAKKAGYSNLGNLSTHLHFSQEDLGNLAASGGMAAATGGADIGADIAAGKSVLNLVKNLFKKKAAPVTTHDVFQWPPESEFPKDAWNALINSANPGLATLNTALKTAKDLVTDYTRQIGVHTAAGNAAAASNVTTWKNKAQEFVDALTDKITEVTDPNKGKTDYSKDLQDTYSNNQQDPNLENRDPAKKLKDKMAKDADKPDDTDKFLGMPKNIGIGVLIGAIILILALIAWLYFRNRKKKLAQGQKQS